MTEPREAKHSTFQVVTTMLTIFVVIFVAFSVPVLKGAWGDIKNNSHRLNGLITQQELTKQNRKYMEKRFNYLEENFEKLKIDIKTDVQNITKSVVEIIISRDMKGQVVGHSQPKI